MLHVTGSVVSFPVPAKWYWSFNQLVLQFQLAGTAVSVSWHWEGTIALRKRLTTLSHIRSMD